MPFPEKFSKSSFGIKLTQIELRQRTIDLDKWMKSLFKNFSNLSGRSHDLLFGFLELEYDVELDKIVINM